MKFIGLIISIMAISLSCSSFNSLQNKDYEMINNIITNPDILKEISYPEQVEFKDIFKHNFSKNMLISSIDFLKRRFSDGYNIFYERRLVSSKFQVEFSEIALSNKSEDKYFEFCFIHSKDECYLLNAIQISKIKKYLILGGEPNMYKYNDTLFQNNYSFINQIINDSTRFYKEVEKSKKFEEYFLLFDDDYCSFVKFIINYLNRIKDKNYIIKAEKKYSTIDKDLMNHRICIEFTNKEQLFISLVYTDGEWYLENINSFWDMNPFNDESAY